jgi:hypothetical protein
VEEIIAVTAIDDFQKRLRSYELLSDVLTEANKASIPDQGQEVT